MLLKIAGIINFKINAISIKTITYTISILHPLECLVFRFIFFSIFEHGLYNIYHTLTYHPS